MFHYITKEATTKTRETTPLQTRMALLIYKHHDQAGMQIMYKYLQAQQFAKIYLIPLQHATTRQEMENEIRQIFSQQQQEDAAMDQAAWFALRFKKLDKFKQQKKEHDPLLLVYFAGFAFCSTSDGTNYLVPQAALQACETHYTLACTSLKWLVRYITEQVHFECTKVFVLDASDKYHPFAHVHESREHGLSQLDFALPINCAIIYSTSACAHKHSDTDFAHCLQHVLHKNVPCEDAFTELIDLVMQQSNGKQKPSIWHNLPKSTVLFQ